MTMKDMLPEPTLRRLSYYLRYLERFKKNGMEIISSKELSKALGLSDAQIRRDLFILGGFGKRGVGYNIDRLHKVLNTFLGLEKKQEVILVGCGNLGRALLQYKGFKKRHFKITHTFDNSKKLIGKKIEGIVIEDIADMKRVVKRHKIAYGIITTPDYSAQEVVDKMVDAGIKAILNFAPIKVYVPRGVFLTSVDLTIELEQLSCYVHRCKKPTLKKSNTKIKK